jgi:hypothetical protein
MPEIQPPSRRQAAVLDAARSLNRSYRVELLNFRPIQDLEPLYRRLAAAPEIALTVLYCSLRETKRYLNPDFGDAVKRDVPLLDGYHELLPNLRADGRVGGFLSLVNPNVVGELLRNRFDALWLHGYNYLTHSLAGRVDSSPRWQQSALSGRVVVAVRLAGAAVPAGTAAQAGPSAAVVQPRRIHEPRHRQCPVLPPPRHRGRLAIPRPVLGRQRLVRRIVSRCRPARAQIRSELGIAPDAITFLFLVKKIPLKLPLEILQTHGRVPATSKVLLIAGDGPLRDQAEAYVRERRLKGVWFLGLVNQSELPRVYGASDVLVRPDGVTKGDWGLVNAARASGLAVIATDAIGASIDLIRDGNNGFMVLFGDLEELAAAVSRAATGPERCQLVGRRSSEIIATWGIAQCVEDDLQALHSLTRSKDAQP